MIKRGGKKMATLRKKGNAYFIDYRVHGRRVRKNVGPSKKMAELALKDLEVKIARDELGFAKKDGAFQKLISEYKDYGKTNLAPSTRKRYGAIIDNFLRFLENRYPYIEKISQFTPKIFEDFKGFRKEEGAENRTVNAEMIVIRMMFRLAVQWGYAKANPTDGVSKLRIPSKNAPRFLSEEECQKLLAASDEFLRPIFFTFLSTGMRKSELENLEWEDVDFDRRKIRIRVKDNWSPKSNEREIPMNDGLVEVLRRQTQKTNGSRFVFPDEAGGSIYKNRLRKRLMTLTKKLGFGEITQVHALRHTFASHLVMKGVDLATIKKLMGHSDIDTTMIYSHLTDKHVDEAVDKLSFS
jgi:site-specific recombinase XerD